MDVIPWHPSFTDGVAVAGFHLAPHLLAAGHAADVAVGIGVLTSFELGNHIVETTLAFLVSCACIGHG